MVSNIEFDANFWLYQANIISILIVKLLSEKKSTHVFEKRAAAKSYTNQAYHLRPVHQAKNSMLKMS